MCKCKLDTEVEDTDTCIKNRHRHLLKKIARSETRKRKQSHERPGIPLYFMQRPNKN